MPRLVIGFQSVREAVRAFDARVERIYLMERNDGRQPPNVAALLRIAAERHIHVETVPRGKLDSMTKGGHHQGVVAVVPDLVLANLDDIIDSNPSLITIVDRVVDPQNFGAIIRSSIAFGSDAIIWGEHANAPLTPATFRASAGAIEHARLCRVASLTDAIDRLRAADIVVVALAGEAEHTLCSLDLKGPTALVVGSEESGIRRGLRSRCNAVARLPTRPPISSLNASAAAAIALYEVRRQRISPTPSASGDASAI